MHTQEVLGEEGHLLTFITDKKSNLVIGELKSIFQGVSVIWPSLLL